MKAMEVEQLKKEKSKLATEISVLLFDFYMRTGCVASVDATKIIRLQINDGRGIVTRINPVISIEI